MSSDLAVSFNLVDGGMGGASDRLRFAALCRFVLDCENQTGPWEINLALVADDDLRALHARFLNDDTVTDVMTFPAEEPDQEGGDIVISLDRAAEQGPENGHSLAEEVDFLFVHGLLHLCGWDDRDGAARAAMLERQMELSREFIRRSGWGISDHGW